MEHALIFGTVSDTLYWNAFEIERDAPVAEAIVAVHLPAGISLGGVRAEPRVGGRGVGLPRRPETALERIDDAPDAIVYRATNIGAQSLSLVLTCGLRARSTSPGSISARRRMVLAAPGAFFFFIWSRGFGSV